jgi:hypothetical protein
MRVLGPETADDRELRAWFEEQERGNLERLEVGAQTLIQLITGLYGVLFAVLALSDQPAYLQRPLVQWAGTFGVCAFFGSLLAAMLIVIPRRISYQQDNLTEMRQRHRSLLRRKATLLRLAQLVFLLGSACLVTVIVAILWAF